MKRIWQEKIALGRRDRKTYTPAGYRRSYDAEYFATHTDYYTLSVTAVYDRKRQILGITAEAYVLRANAEYQDAIDCLTDRQVLEFQQTREEAIRSVLAHSDEWTAQACLAMPTSDTRSDKQVKADWYAQHAETVAEQ